MQSIAQRLLPASDRASTLSAWHLLDTVCGQTLVAGGTRYLPTKMRDAADLLVGAGLINRRRETMRCTLDGYVVWRNVRELNGDSE